MTKQFPLDMFCEIMSEDDSEAFIRQNGDDPYKPTWYRISILGKNGEEQAQLFDRIRDAVSLVENNLNRREA